MRYLLLAALLAVLAACSNQSCSDYVADVGDICLPAAVPPDIESSIEIRELCGRGCTSQPACNATLRNGAVVLDVSQEICSDAFFLSCVTSPCLQRVVRCKLPALTPGDYTLTAPGAPQRLLKVGPGGTPTCRFPVADAGT
jgi:hypothetical protein